VAGGVRYNTLLVTSFRLILVRHGETEWNRAPRFMGWRDVSLSDEGRRQAELTARALANCGAAAIVSSPLARARETAEAIAKPHRLAVTVDDAFREMSYGAWEGLSVDEVVARFPDLHRQWREAPHTVRFEGGEDLATARARALAGVAALREFQDGATVVVVSHGLVIRLIALDALGLGPDRLRAVHAAPSGITEIEYRPDWATVHRMNTLSHLEQPLEP
jgi:broad specificity phosphatase PhoE